MKTALEHEIRTVYEKENWFVTWADEILGSVQKNLAGVRQMHVSHRLRENGMTELLNFDENLRVASQVRICATLGERLKGLLGTPRLDEDQAVWIQRCNSIHTFFMSMTIDVAFLDDQLLVVKLISGVTPWRICLPVFRATSVVEGPVGMIRRGKLRQGSQLQVI